MAIDTAHYKELLVAREKELSEEISRFNENGRESQTGEVEDPLDKVTSSQAKAAAFGASNVAADTLLAVKAALQRIETGEYGVCLDCGREIEPKRLEAVPWSAHCLKDREKRDREQAAPQTLDANSAL